MAESQLVRVLGVDPNIPNPIPLQAPSAPRMPDITGQKFAEARQSQEAAFQSQLNAINAVADAKVREAQAKSQSPGAEQFASIVGHLTGGLALYQKTLNERQKVVDENYAEQQKAQNEEGNVLAQNLIRDKLLELRSKIVDGASDVGIEKTRGDFELVLNKQFKDLPPKMREELWRVAFSGLDEVASKQSERTFQQFKETKETWRDQQFAQLNASTAAFSVRLGTAKSVDEQQQAWKGFWDTFNQGTQGLQLDAKDKSYIATKLLNQAVENYQGGEKNRQLLVQSANAVNQFYQQIQPIVDKYNKGEIGEFEYRATLRYLAQTNGVPELVSDVPDIFSTTDKATQYERNQQSLEQMALDRSQVINFDDKNRAEFYHIGALTYEIISNSPESRMLMQAAKDTKRVSPLLQSAIQAAEDFNKDRKEWNDLQRQFAQASVQVAKVLDDVQPGRLGDPQFLDTLSGVLKQAETQKDPKTGLPIIRPQASPEVYAAVQQMRDSILPAMMDLRDRWLAIGLNIENPRDNQYIKQLEAQTSGTRKAAEQYQPKQGGSVFPNFNRGVTTGYPSTPPVAAFGSLNGVKVPFAANTPISVSSGYGWRTHPIHGDKRFHAGMDFAPTSDRDTGALTIQGGQVIVSENWGGYGGTVMVRTPDGRVEQYSHLRRLNVKKGQTIPPGFNVGLLGGDPADPMAGDSTGRHLHFQVWMSDNDFSNPQTGTIDPQRYLASVKHPTMVARGLGLPPSQTAPGRMGGGFGYYKPIQPQLGRGGWMRTQPNLMVRQRIVFNNANPQRNGYASIQKRDYGRNNPQANYGYEALGRDPSFARKIASVADSIGFPAQWLADVMAFETGGTFSPGIRNEEGATGLIQFYPDAAYGTVKTMNGRRINLLEIAGWSRTKQMELVHEYLSEFKGRINTAEDLLAAIFGGAGLHGKSPQARASVQDSNIDFAKYMRRLGEHAGRRYQTSYDRAQVSMQRVHSAPVGGCPTCQNQVRKYGEVIPHEAPLR